MKYMPVALLALKEAEAKKTKYMPVALLALKEAEDMLKRKERKTVVTAYNPPMKIVATTSLDVEEPDEEDEEVEVLVRELLKELGIKG